MQTPSRVNMSGGMDMHGLGRPQLLQLEPRDQYSCWRVPEHGVLLPAAVGSSVKYHLTHVGILSFSLDRGLLL